MGQSYSGDDRRKSIRLPKNYSLYFYIKDSSDKRSESAFIKDFSRGGVRFTSSHAIDDGGVLVFEISVPYIAPKKLILEGIVISCKEIITPRMVFEIRAKFNQLDAPTVQLFNLIENRNAKGS